ncbi:hypothetical protein ABW20_dc0109993 [Dactylellina cionopaga]|nr:hypothetical protein ABW20_dc0109993 [Dactylellina cionopaga]
MDTAAMWSPRDGGLIGMAMGMTLAELRSVQLRSPPELEEAVVHDIIYFDFEKRTGRLVNPYTFFESAPSLKKLSISAPSLVQDIGGAQGPIFSSVEKLSIQLSEGFGERHLEDLGYRFPNLYDFSIELPFSGNLILQDTYGCDWMFKKLKRARLVWPINTRMRADNLTVDVSGLHYTLITSLCPSLPELEEVEFVKKIRRSGARIGNTFEICRFAKAEDQSWLQYDISGEIIGLWL